MNPGPDATTLNGKMEIKSYTDVVDIRSKVRDLCNRIGFSLPETTRVVTATSELARNIIEFAGTGEVRWKILENDSASAPQEETVGIELTFEDDGPGIEDLEWAMQDGTSTGNGLGKGLPGAKKLMDEMEVESGPGSGTRIILKKWTVGK